MELRQTEFELQGHNTLKISVKLNAPEAADGRAAGVVHPVKTNRKLIRSRNGVAEAGRGARKFLGMAPPPQPRLAAGRADMPTQFEIPLRGPSGEPVDLFRTFMSHGVADLLPGRVDE